MAAVGAEAEAAAVDAPRRPNQRARDRLERWAVPRGPGDSPTRVGDRAGEAEAHTSQAGNKSVDDAATLGDLREAVTTLEDAERIARRVLGGAHPVTGWLRRSLRNARAALRARESPPDELDEVEDAD